MRTRNFNPHSTLVGCSPTHPSHQLLLLGLLVLALSSLAYPQRDLNKEKPKESPPAKAATPVRKKKTPTVKPKAELNVTVASSNESKKAVVEGAPRGVGGIILDLDALKLDPFDEPDLHFLIDGVELADKKKKSATRIEFENIPNGSYTLTVKHPTIEDCKQEVVVKIGLTLYLAPVFNIKRGKLIVLGEQGTKVFLDDKLAASINEDGEAILYPSIGRHTLKLMKDGQAPAQKTIDVFEGENIEQIEKTANFE